MQKAIITFIVCLVGFNTAHHINENVENYKHTLVVGNREEGDRILVSLNVLENGSTEKTFYVPRHTLITQVVASDMELDGNGALPSVIRGGPGYQYVTLKFDAQQSYGVNFKVKIYGY